MTKCVQPRIWNTVAPWPELHRDTRDRPGATCANGHEKTAAPGQGTSGVRLVVPPHFAAMFPSAASPRTARRRAMRRLVNGSRFALPGARRRLLGHACRMSVRSGARRSFSPAFLVPLCSDRGSLARFRRVLVLVMASVFGYERTLAAMAASVNGSIRHQSYGSKSASRSMATFGSDSGRTIPSR